MVTFLFLIYCVNIFDVEKKKNSNLTPEQQEKRELEIENNLLKYLLPSVGITAVIIGTVGFILTLSVNVGVAIFLLIIAIFGLGGIAYGVYHLFLRRWKKIHKEEVVPSETPNEKPAA